MIYVQFNGERYGIQFAYQRSIVEHPRGKRKLFSRREIVLRNTICDIFTLGTDPEAKPELNSEALVGQGIAYQHYNDNFCKETGRKLALKRALIDMSAASDKEFRIAAWKAYRGRKLVTS